MLIKLPKTSDSRESGALALGSLPRWASAGPAVHYADVEAGNAPAWFTGKLPDTRWGAITAGDESITPYKDATHYNNFYEFGTDKGDPAQNAGSLDRALVGGDRW